MHLHERIVGFDARKLIDLSSWWDEIRRETYLLHPTVSRILSSDEHVWPSVFDCNRVEGAKWNPEADLAMQGPALPDVWIGENEPLWSSLADLKKNLAVLGDQIFRPHSLIAVTCLAAPDVHDWTASFPYAGEVSPDAGTEDWRFLGFDVSDGAWSALTNCGFRETDFVNRSRQDWARCLNDSHLFQDSADADAFRLFSDARVPEHAPFLVFGLYEIEVVTE